ncbi:hypothetical protein RP20_CCG009930 [Aedes albopictus]|nr:hypothetical protein RP20_CCG009930 [Aedes albopictus]
MTETLQLRGQLVGHSGWVTQIATNPKYPDMILSSSRDKTLIVWKLTRDDASYGIPQKRLYGHSHFISDVVLSSDGNYALSGSWDKTLRLWDLAAGKSTRRFEDHTKEDKRMAYLTILTGYGRFWFWDVNPCVGTMIPTDGNTFGIMVGRDFEVNLRAYARQKKHK